MRTSDWIQIGLAVALALAAWVTPFTSQPLPVQRRLAVAGLAGVAIAVLSVGRLCAGMVPAASRPVLHDGFTVAVFLVPYWQAGQFFVGPNAKIEERLLAFDRRLLPGIAGRSGTARSGVGFLLELAYLLCYPLVPLGLVAVYAAGRGAEVNSFWLVVLLSTYICYVVTPFVPAYPPRSLVGEGPGGSSPAVRANTGRIFNRWILRHGSIHAISFPSAHVAAAFAIALVLLRLAPPFGIAFLALAILISAGAVVGRYHYALDVLLGGATALAVFLASYRAL